MFKNIFLLLVIFSFSVFAEVSTESLNFAVKNSFDRNIVKSIEFQSGESFSLGKNHTAHVLYYTAKVNGIPNQIKVNCKVRNSDDKIEYCKPVKMVKI